MKLSITQALLFGIPENIAYALFCWTLLNSKIVLNKVLMIALIQTAIYFLVRALPLPFGVHTLIGIVTLSFIMKHYSKQYLSKIFIVVLISFFIAGFGEFINITILGRVWGREAVFDGEGQNFALIFCLFQFIYLYAVVFFAMLLKKRKLKTSKVFEKL
jgi:hypothetical protein